MSDTIDFLRKHFELPPLDEVLDATKEYTVVKEKQPIVFKELPKPEQICKLQLTNSYLKAKDAGEIE